MACEVITSELARSDLDDIWFWGASHRGAEASDLYLDRLDAEIGRLADYPELGRTRTDLAPGLRSLGVEAHVVFYTHTDNKVRIERILRGERDAPSVIS